MKSQYLRKLGIPDAPGVYIFRDVNKRPLYIGRATSLKDRVKSYFSNDLIETRGPRVVDMVTRSKRLTFQEAGSVLEAILLEARLIKRYQPKYNVDDRDDKSSQYVVITEEQWPRVFLVRERDFDKAQQRKGKMENGTKENSPLARGRLAERAGDVLPYKVKRIFGPYPHSGLIKEALKILRKMFPFRDRKSHDPRHESFYRSLGRSPQGTDAAALRRYRRTIDYLVLFFEGQKNRLRKKLERDMNTTAKKMEFEEASRLKRLLYALDHINDMALMKSEKNRGLEGEGGHTSREFRMEAYDIAHLSGTNVVGAMTVSINGEFTSSEYRMFKISREKNDDLAGLVEVLSRRLNHTEWAYPDLIVVDGDDRHVRAAEAVLASRRISISVVAVTKDEKHRASKVIGYPEIVNQRRKDIIALNGEAHRFVIRYHRRRRGKLLS